MRRRFQFSLRGIFIAVTALAVWMGCHTELVRRRTEAAHRRSAAVRAIRGIGAEVNDDGTCAVCFYSSQDVIRWGVGTGVEFKPLSDSEIEAVIPHLQSLSPNVVYLHDVASKFGSATFSDSIQQRLQTALPECRITKVEPFTAWQFPHPRKKAP